MTERQLLVIAHTPSPNLKKVRDAFVNSARTAAQSASCALNVVSLAPLDSNSEDVEQADAVVLITPENLGYMSGALKDWFDRIYYPVLESKQGLPCTAIIRAGHDGTGTERAINTITTGLRWRWVQPPVILKGDWQEFWISEISDLGEGIAVALSEGMI